MYKIPIVNIILNSERLGPFTIKLATRQECHCSLLLFNKILVALTSVISHKNETKDIQIRKNEIHLSLFTDNMIIWNIQKD